MAESVRLKLAREEHDAGGGFTFTFCPVSVKVQNIAFSKDVVVHYTPDGTNWKDFPLGFSSPFGDYDIFRGTVNEGIDQFVIRYSVSGRTFFDNNSGRNYRPGPTVVGGNVILNKATARQGIEGGGGSVVTTSWVEGEILVNNLSFVKDVGIRLSVDGIQFNDIRGSFAGQNTSDDNFVGPGAEVWRFESHELNLDTSSPEFRFAVFYRNGATGELFWDNNFGQDYKVSKADGATIE